MTMGKQPLTPPNKLTGRAECPGCHQLRDTLTWTRDETIFQTLDCPQCAVEYGRVNRGPWHVVGALSADGSLQLHSQPHLEEDERG